MINGELRNLYLFLNFIKGDHRCYNANKEELKKRKIPGAELDYPLLRYVHSLDKRITMLSILHQNILKQNLEAIEDFKKTQEKGIGSSITGIALVMYFELFVNQVYNIFENIGKINLFLFNDLKDHPPQKFSDQLEKVEQKKLTFSPCFDVVLESMKSWYPQAMNIRHNVNHFMTGFNVYSRENEGAEEWYLEYMNFDVIDRDNQKIKKIQVDIRKKTVEYYNFTLDTLDRLSVCYIEKMDKNTLCQIPLLTENGLEIREISFNQYISGKPGKLLFPYPDK